MRTAKPLLFASILLSSVSLTSAATSRTTRWTEQKANEWYAKQPWLIGSNYIPRSTINQLEMWQEATFNPEQIDQEFG